MIYCDCDCTWCELLHQDTENQKMVLEGLKWAIDQSTDKIFEAPIKELMRRLTNE